MRLSNHTIIVEDYPAPGECLLYSTRTQGMVKISQAFKDILQNFESINENLDENVQEMMLRLHQIGMVVEDDADEQQQLKDFLEDFKYTVDDMFAVTVLTTYACNFKCTYCFQESSREYVKMEEATQKRTIDWIKRRVQLKGHQQLYVNYYGGEPLLNRPAIERISTDLQAWSQAQGIKFSFGLQTNGYLLKPALVDQYLKWGLRNVRISLDGVGDDHDRQRPLRGGGGTFQRIIENIVACADKIPIGVSVGYEKSNIEPIARLIQYLEDLGILHKLDRFLFSPIHPTLGPKGNAEAIQSSHCMRNYEDKTMVEANRQINALMKAKGLPNKSGMATSACPLTKENSGVTIDQHGRLYRCNSMLGHPELAVGDVCSDEFNEKQREFRDLNVWQQCPQDCTFLPMCGGSCRLSSFLKNRNFKTPTCHKPYLIQMAPELIKKEYETKLAKRRKEQKQSLAVA